MEHSHVGRLDFTELYAVPKLRLSGAAIEPTVARPAEDCNSQIYRKAV